MQVDILDYKSQKKLCTLENLKPVSTINDVKKEYNKKFPRIYVERQSFRLEPNGRAVKEEDTLEGLNVKDGSKLYYKDLGPQIGWKTVYIIEYTCPLLCYIVTYLRPPFLYGAGASSQPYADVVNIAAACFAGHFIKRILETIFVHRFSRATMPLRNVFKNSIFYGGNAALIGYFVNHPLYTPASFGNVQIYSGLAIFLISEYGNYVCHCLLRDLRPPGTKERRIPYPTSNPMTQMLRLTSCPNYTYELYSWTGFTVMTQTLTAAVFTLLGFYQMSIWALERHRKYRKEFKDYPKSRKAMIPFFL